MIKKKICIGIDEYITQDELDAYLKSGANEFFMGFIPENWSNIYNYDISMNRRYEKNTQFVNKLKLIESIKFIHNQSGLVFLTLNEHHYSMFQKKLIYDVLLLLNSHFDALIIGDIELIKFLNEKKLNQNIYLSGDFETYNSQTIKFIKNLGVKRVLLPRELSLNEIQLICNQNPDMEFEVFILGEPCLYNSSSCFAIHGFNLEPFCNIINNEYLIDKKTGKVEREIFNKGKFYRNLQINKTYNAFFDEIGRKCGACSLSFFNKIPNIVSLKIPGRGRRIVRSIKFINNISLYQDKDSIKSELKKIFNLDDELMTKFCNGDNCYYDE